MQDGSGLKIWARTVMLFAVVLLAATLFRPQPVGFDLAVNERGLSFELKAAFINIAFDIGQDRPISNSLGRFF